MKTKVRVFWRELSPLGWGWVEQDGLPPDDYLDDVVAYSTKHPVTTFQMAIVRPPTRAERTLHRACQTTRCGSIVRYMLVDERGTPVYDYETSLKPMKAMDLLVYTAAVDNWLVD